MPNDAVSRSSSSHSSSSSSASDMPNDAVSALASNSSSSASPSRYSDIWNYLWVPLFISYTKELSLAKAEPTILLPNQIVPESPRCVGPSPKLNYRPVIGILSHPGDGASGRLSNATNASYIAASYVKFVESAGARVIPLIYNEPPEILFEVKYLFLFPLSEFGMFGYGENCSNLLGFAWGVFLITCSDL